MKYFAIWNESRTGDDPGLPACYCYVGAALESSLLVFDSVGDPLTNREDCIDLVNSNKLVYFFEVNSTEVKSDGGALKKKTNRKRKTNIRIKIKKSSKARKAKKSSKARKANKSGEARKAKKSGKARKAKKTQKLKY